MNLDCSFSPARESWLRNLFQKFQRSKSSKVPKIQRSKVPKVPNLSRTPQRELQIEILFKPDKKLPWNCYISKLQIWFLILKESICYETDKESDKDFDSYQFHIWFLSCLVHVHFISDFNLKPTKLRDEKLRIFWFLAISWLILLLKLGAVNKSDKNQIWNGNY